MNTLVFTVEFDLCIFSVDNVYIENNIDVLMINQIAFCLCKGVSP